MSLDHIHNRLELVEQLLDIQMRNVMSPEDRANSTLAITRDHPAIALLKRREKGLYEIFRFYSG